MNSVRNARGIAAFAPATDAASTDGSTEIVSISRAERILGVSRVTLYRWLREGFIIGEQLTPGAPWCIRIDDTIRARVVGDAPEGWLRLQAAAAVLGVARQTVLDRVRRGELRAVHVTRGQRGGLMIEIPAGAESLFDAAT